MPDVNQITQDQTLEQQNPVAPSPTAPVQLQSQPINDAVAPTSSMHYKKHSLPISFKSISLIILFLLVGSVFVISQLSSQKGSLDLRSRAAKKEGNVLKNGSFEQNLLNWKEIKKDKSDRISIITQSPTQGTKAVKLVNVSGKELNLYQDVKVDPDTWYTIRVDGTRSEGSGPAYFEVKEYDLINGNPSFHGDRLTRRSFNKSFQSRGNIVRTGGAKMVTQNTRQFFQRVYAVSGTSCTKEQIDKCGSSGGCNSDWQRCTKNGNKYECIYNSGFCGIYNASFNITPKQESCVANLGGECVLNSQCKLGGFYAIPRGGFSDCRDMGTHGCCAKTSIIETTEKFCSPGGVIKCGKEIPKFEADKCDKTRYGCILNDITGIYRWVEIGEKYSCLDISPKCPNPPVGGTPTPSVPPKSGCTSDDDCTKIKSDTYCEAGVCKDRPANCGTTCYDPAEGDIPAETIEGRCSPLTCAPPQDGGKRYCWGDGCGGGGGGGGQKPAEKYIRIQLTLDKKGSAIFDNARFAKGQDNAAPKITSSAPTVATVGAKLRYQVLASDEDKDALIFGLGAMPCPFDNRQCKQEERAIPKGAAVAQTGLFTFTPEASGTANIRLWVFDRMKPVKQDFKLRIN